MFRENVQNCFSNSISGGFDLVRKICCICMRNMKETKREMACSGFSTALGCLRSRREKFLFVLCMTSLLVNIFRQNMLSKSFNSGSSPHKILLRSKFYANYF